MQISPKDSIYPSFEWLEESRSEDREEPCLKECIFKALVSVDTNLLCQTCVESLVILLVYRRLPDTQSIKGDLTPALEG